jgi:hypothetical protein
LTERIDDYKCGHSRRILRSHHKRKLGRAVSSANPLLIGIANATVPSCFSAYGAYVAKIYNAGVNYDGTGNRTTSVTTTHPVVSTQCWPSHYDGNYTGFDSEISYLHDNGMSLGVLFDLRTLVTRVSNFSGSSSAASQTDNDVTFPPIWTASPELGSHSLIGVFPFWRRDNQTEESPPSLSWVMTQTDLQTQRRKLSIKTCTISAYWNTGEVQMIETQGIADVQTSMMTMWEPHEVKPITLDVANIKVMQSPEFSRDLSAIVDKDLEVGLSEMLAIALSAIPSPNPTLADLVPPSPNDHNTTPLRFTSVLYGYGYATRSTSILLAMAVMLTYCIITLLYIVYILITGSTSTAWNSAIELVALALQSRRPDHLGKIGVGLDSIHTFKEGVGIRVNQDNELELVFAHDRDIDKRGLRKIERNKEY